LKIAFLLERYVSSRYPNYFTLLFKINLHDTTSCRHSFPLVASRSVWLLATGGWTIRCQPSLDFGKRLNTPGCNLLNCSIYWAGRVVRVDRHPDDDSGLET